LLRGDRDASLVSVQGVLLESVRRHGARVLVMQLGEFIFHAQLGLDGQDGPPLPVAGSLLELTGIAVVAETNAEGAHLSPRMFSLLLRAPADIRILRQPPWWTARRLWQALEVISVTVLGILAWVWLLRRQVRVQTAALKERTQREAIFEERTRIAQELHDTLDQELTGLSLQLNAVQSQVTNDDTGQRLSLIHRLLLRSQGEVRRSVWDLRRSAAGAGSLAAALQETITQLRAGSAAAAGVTVHGTERPLPALVEHHVARIAAEAITNAFKHAAASRVSVDLFYEPDAVRLVVADDGRGFVADDVPGHAAGHFGLIGMRERSRKIGGYLLLFSQPGQGTRIELRLSSAPRPRAALSAHANRPAVS
jgi:signal transduction histidine kinase